MNDFHEILSTLCNIPTNLIDFEWFVLKIQDFLIIGKFSILLWAVFIVTFENFSRISSLFNGIFSKNCHSYCTIFQNSIFFCIIFNILCNWHEEEPEQFFTIPLPSPSLLFWKKDLLWNFVQELLWILHSSVEKFKLRVFSCKMISLKKKETSLKHAERRIKPVIPSCCKLHWKYPFL